MYKLASIHHLNCKRFCSYLNINYVGKLLSFPEQIPQTIPNPDHKNKVKRKASVRRTGHSGRSHMMLQPLICQCIHLCLSPHVYFCRLHLLGAVRVDPFLSTKLRYVASSAILETLYPRLHSVIVHPLIPSLWVYWVWFLHWRQREEYAHAPGRVSALRALPSSMKDET